MEAWLRKLSSLVHITAQNSICNAKDILHQLYFYFIVFSTELIAFYSFYQLHSSKDLNTFGLKEKKISCSYLYSYGKVDVFGMSGWASPFC